MIRRIWEAVSRRHINLDQLTVEQWRSYDGIITEEGEDVEGDIEDVRFWRNWWGTVFFSYVDPDTGWTCISRWSRKSCFWDHHRWVYE